MYGYGYFKLSYEQLYEDLDLYVFLDMLQAHTDMEVRELDNDMSKLAWQTFYLLRAQGVELDSPNDLYVPIKERTGPVTAQDIKAKEAELKELFGLDNMGGSEVNS